MAEAIAWKDLVDRLNALLRLKSTPVGMKLFTSREDVQAIPKIRVSDAVFTLCQLVGQSVRLNWTVAAFPENFPAPQCGVIAGMIQGDEEWLAGKSYKGVWFETYEDASLHQQSFDIIPPNYQGLAVAPLAGGRLAEPDVCIIYLTPGQLFMMMSGLNNIGYKKRLFSNVGESSCADGWARAFITGEPSVSIPCYAERRFAGVTDDEMLICLKPADLVKAVEGLERLSKNGLRYPIPAYGVQLDVRAGLAKSYS